jgi:hypothetical protein
MGLQQQLDAFKAEFARTAPAGRPALYDSKIEELRAGFALERAIGLDDRAPDFTLPNPQGRTVSLRELAAGRTCRRHVLPRRLVPAIASSAPTRASCRR